MAERALPVSDPGAAAELFGSYDENIKYIESQFDVSVTLRDGEIRVSGEEGAAEAATRALSALTVALRRGEPLSEQTLRYAVSLVKSGEENLLPALYGSACVAVTAKGKPVKSRTVGQRRYTDAIKANTVTLGIGPAGTGKTYLAVALAVEAFRAKAVDRIILTRPAVEAGERLGFLPGDLQAKVDPYLRPLYDALFDLLGPENFSRCRERGDIEVAPLAYMRGRTLDNSFIVLDEAQNTTREQMKMFLTRLGENSKVVVTGDLTQIDLPEGKRSGLRDAAGVLRGVEGVATVYLSEKDVVRHKLVQEIVKAYERAEARGGGSPNAPGDGARGR